MKNAPYCPRVSIVIPTLRECENLRMLLPRVAASLTTAGHSFEIVVVDDDSRDGTSELCMECYRRWPVRFLTRVGQRGLSSAVVHGMDRAQGELVAVMDADLSHPPEKLPELVLPLIEQQAEFVIGSRYVAGANISRDWNMLRYLQSRAATLLARPLVNVKDPMAGFFALRRDIYLQHRHHIKPLGYKIALEILVKCHCQRVIEIPIRFDDRVQGSSKLGLLQQFAYLCHVARLYAFRTWNAARSIRQNTDRESTAAWPIIAVDKKAYHQQVRVSGRMS